MNELCNKEQCYKGTILQRNYKKKYQISLDFNLVNSSSSLCTKSEPNLYVYNQDSGRTGQIFVVISLKLIPEFYRE